jgi:hypothetical protein
MSRHVVVGRMPEPLAAVVVVSDCAMDGATPAMVSNAAAEAANRSLVMLDSFVMIALLTHRHQTHHLWACSPARSANQIHTINLSYIAREPIASLLSLGVS